jgi:hypothetical protein
MNGTVMWTGDRDPFWDGPSAFHAHWPNMPALPAGLRRCCSGSLGPSFLRTLTHDKKRAHAIRPTGGLTKPGLGLEFAVSWGGWSSHEAKEGGLATPPALCT